MPRHSRRNDARCTGATGFVALVQLAVIGVRERGHTTVDLDVHPWAVQRWTVIGAINARRPRDFVRGLKAPSALSPDRGHPTNSCPTQ